VLCAIVVYELRHGAESSSDPRREHAKLDTFLAPFSSLPFDDACAVKCAEIRRALERNGKLIGPHDLQIAAVAQPLTRATCRCVTGCCAAICPCRDAATTPGITLSAHVDELPQAAVCGWLSTTMEHATSSRADVR
jgi:hypothetical protein